MGQLNTPLDIIIVIPVYNRRDLTLRCLESLANVDKSGMNIVTVVVNDGSTDGTREEVKKRFPDVVILEGDGNLWWTGGVNMGVRYALIQKAKYVLLLNDDTIQETKFLKVLVNTAKNNPRSIVSALLLRYDNPTYTFQIPRNRWERRGWTMLPSQEISGLPTESWEVGFIPGNCVLYPSEVFKEIGLCDEKVFPHAGADCDISVRAKKHGWQLLVVPGARVWNELNKTQRLRNLNLRQVLHYHFINKRAAENIFTHVRLIWRTAPSVAQAVGAIAWYILNLIERMPRVIFYRIVRSAR